MSENTFLNLYLHYIYIYITFTPKIRQCNVNVNVNVQCSVFDLIFHVLGMRSSGDGVVVMKFFSKMTELC